MIGLPFHRLGMTQRAPSIVIASAPMLTHAETRKLAVFGMSLILVRAIDQMDDVVNVAVVDRVEEWCFRAAL